MTNNYFVKTSTCYYLYENNMFIASCNFCFSENNLYITSLHVNHNYRLRGFGTKILYEVLIDSYLNHNVRYAFLADATDRYRQKNNIYTKMGFTYIKISDDNDMIGNLRHMLFGIKSDRNKV